MLTCQLLPFGSTSPGALYNVGSSSRHVFVIVFIFKTRLLVFRLMCMFLSFFSQLTAQHCTSFACAYQQSVGLVQRGYSIPSPVLLKCCVASIVAQSVLFSTCTGQPAVWGFFSLGLTHCDRVFLFSEVQVGGPWWVWSLFRSVAGQLFLQYFDAVGWVF